MTAGESPGASRTIGTTLSSAPSEANANLATPELNGPAMTSHVLSILAGIALMVSFSESMLIPALPTIQTEFNTTASAVSWVPAIYLLVGAISVPVFGKLGDIYGKKRILVFVMTAYTIAVVLDGFAWSLESLLAFRAIQGLGLAMFPLAFSLIHDEMTPERVPVATGVVSAMNGVGAAVGLIGGAYITQTFSWQTNYHFLAPVAVAVTFLLWRFGKESPQRQLETIDYLGAGLFAVAVSSLLVAVTEGATLGWTSAGTLTLFALAGIFSVLLVRRERRAKEPLIHLKLPHIREMLKTNFMMFVAGAGLFLGFYAVIYFLQEQVIGFGLDVSKAALILFPGAVLMLVFAPLAGRLVKSQGPKLPTLVGLLLLLTAFLSLLAFHRHEYDFLVSAIFLFGGVGMLFTSLLNSILILSPPERVGSQTGTNTIFQLIGQSIGAAVAGAALTTFVDSMGLSTDEAYGVICGIGAALAALGILVALSMPKLAIKGPLPVAAG